MKKYDRISLLYFLIASIATIGIYYIVLGGHAIVPLAKDSWQQIQNPFVKLKNVGRWLNFLLYGYKHNVTPILGLFLDGLSFAFLAYAILAPLLRKIDYIFVIIIMLFWISSPPNLYFIGYPGGPAPVNLITAVCLYSLHRTTKIKYRILVYAISGILIFGAYESHYFALLFPHITKSYVQSITDVKVHLREFCIWVLGFIIGYFSWQLVHYGVYDTIILPASNYRTLVDNVDISFVERAKLILNQISYSLKFYGQHKIWLINYSSHITIAGLIVCGLYTKSKVEKLLVGLSLIPMIGMVTLLILANYQYFDRIGLAIWACFLVVGVMCLLEKGIRRNISLILIIGLTLSNLIKQKKYIGIQQNNLTASINTILSHIDPEELSTEDVILLFGNMKRSEGFFDPSLAGGMAYQLGVTTVWKCKPKTGGNCRRALKHIANENSFCEPGAEYLGRHQNLHLLKLNQLTILCNN